MINFKRIVQVIFLFVLAFDMLIFVLGNNDFYFSFFKPTGIIIPTLYTILALYLLAWVQKVKRYWVIAGTIVALIFLGNLWLNQIVIDNFYKYVKSPTGNVTLVIEHRDATLGETNHFYNFYRITSFPRVIKKLNIDTVEIVTRGIRADNLEVLGFKNAEWFDGDYVTFHSPYADTKVDLK